MSNFKHLSKVELSIRRKDSIGLPGDDPTLHNLKIGSALKAKSNTPLRGLESMGNQGLVAFGLSSL